jgi:hypothetical protein
MTGFRRNLSALPSEAVAGDQGHAADVLGNIVLIASVGLKTLNKWRFGFIFQDPPIFPQYGRLRANLPSMIDHEDFSVVVKNRAPPPKSWHWEIYRAGRTSAIDHSAVYFASMTEANRAGKAALRAMLSEFPDAS